MAANASNNSQTVSTRKRSSRSTTGRRSHGDASLEDVQEDLRVVTRDIAQLKADAAGAAMHGVQQGAETALESVRTAGLKAKEVHEQAAEWVSEHPTASVLVAIGAGALVARMLTRR